LKIDKSTLEKAKLGYHQAQYDVGEGYLHKSPRTENDCSKALDWLTKAAAGHYPDAEYKIGVLYGYGYGVAHNRKIAIEWYQRAAEQGDGRAKSRIRILEQNTD
jgi:TPR repeat protein